MLLHYTYHPPAKLSQFYRHAFVGCGDLDAPMPRQRHNMNLHSTFASCNNRIFYTSRISAFSFCLKKKTPAKEKQNRGNPPVPPRQRRAAALSSQLSISCSAHSPANAPELELVCNIIEAPPAADEARRCWLKTRSIAPTPRAIGDYVLRVARAACFASRSLAHLKELSNTAARLLRV